MSRITAALAQWVAAGELRMGEVIVTPAGPAEFEVRHYLDEATAAEELKEYRGGAGAREIGLYAPDGEYRPLKTAPNLKRGWLIRAQNVQELHEVLDGFYPAMLAARLAFAEGRLRVTPLRETLQRQSGMYAVTRKISDKDADELIGEVCNLERGCLKRILWAIAPGVAITSLDETKFNPDAGRGVIPMLCAEGCNLLVAKARERVKQREGAAISPGKES